MSAKATQEDLFFLKKTFALAERGLGFANPNPLVGAVIVKHGKIIAQGFHRRFGFPHAEVEALKAARGQVPGATLYVNLEPCSHFGQTPPCTTSIINSGIRRVVCATLDPNPQVHGQGVKKLRAAGISVSVGALTKEAKKLNEIFFTFHVKQRPFITLKFAASLDGKIATKTGAAKWITNPALRQHTRALRRQYQGIIVGINTILNDNPHLGIRQSGGRDPVRIILDSALKIPLASMVLRDPNVIIATTNRAPKFKRNMLEKRGVTVITFRGKNIPLKQLVKKLAKRQLSSLLVEGGGAVIGDFLDQHLADKIYCGYAPIFIGGEKSISAVQGRGVSTIKKATKLKNIIVKQFGDNWLIVGYPRYF